MTDKKFRVEVQTGKDRIESFDIEGLTYRKLGSKVYGCQNVQ